MVLGTLESIRRNRSLIQAALATVLMVALVTWSHGGPVEAAPATGTGTPASAEPVAEVVVTGLEVPWAVDFAPDGRMFITERPGRIRVVRDGVLDPEPWAELPVYGRAEAGLMGLALDPQFDRNGYVYVAQTYSTADGPVNRLLRLREDPRTGKGTIDRVLWDGAPAGPYHDGGRVKFGPDGKLYWTVGDAGRRQEAQSARTLHGTILRLNPDGTVPEDNPFPGSPIYSYGHRNPQGLAWHPDTGVLYATEHGPSGGEGCCHDEVNRIRPGGNYGWPRAVGADTLPGMIPPVLHSGPRTTWAPSGATFVTRGPWRGSLVFTGLRGESLYRVIFAEDNPDEVVAMERWFSGRFGRLRDVVEGPDGALYVLTSNGDGRARGEYPGLTPGSGDVVIRITFTGDSP